MDYTGLKIPTHVAIIMDGNGRWALERGKKRSEGHLAGYENLKTLSEYIFQKGIKVLSIYAFSTENFKRPKVEVDFLMNLFVEKMKEYSDYIAKRDIKVLFSGKRSEPIPKKAIELMNEIERNTEKNSSGILNVCINYGGRLEIVEAVKNISLLVREEKLKIESITEDSFSHYLFQDLPDIDLLIRTSGEVRVSNFMLYQLSYAEMYFPKAYFPSFSTDEFDKAILTYNKRNRRFGGIDYESKNH